jgi:hypothetical protein
MLNKKIISAQQNQTINAYKKIIHTTFTNFPFKNGHAKPNLYTGNYPLRTYPNLTIPQSLFDEIASLAVKQKVDGIEISLTGKLKKSLKVAFIKALRDDESGTLALRMNIEINLHPINNLKNEEVTFISSRELNRQVRAQYWTTYN